MSMAVDFPARLVAHYRTLDRLQVLPRTGYLFCGVPQPETVAAHLFGVSYLVMVLGRHIRDRGAKLDLEKALQIALLHEAGEVFIGDMIPAGKRAFGEGAKETAEARAGGRFLETLDPELEALFRDFLELRSPAAKLVADCDRLQMLLKSRHYLEQGHSGVQEILAGTTYSFHYEECNAVARAAEKAQGKQGPPAMEL